jgi:type IV secretory pathway TraG/TraD family ATPase VirD4
MYRLSRLMLMLTVLCGCYSIAVLAYLFTPAAVLALICLGVGGARRGHGFLSAYGTARWATDDDLRRAGMLEGDGPIVGRLQ